MLTKVLLFIFTNRHFTFFTFNHTLFSIVFPLLTEFLLLWQLWITYECVISHPPSSVCRDSVDFMFLWLQWICICAVAALTQVLSSPDIHHHVILPQLLEVFLIHDKKTSCYHRSPAGAEGERRRGVGGETNWQTVTCVHVSGVSVLLYGGDWVALSGSSLIQGHVIPFKHQIPVKAYQNTHTGTKEWDYRHEVG